MNQLKAPRHSPQSDYRFWERKGVLGWWLNLTAPRPPMNTALLKERERIRKAELTSIGMLAIFACLVALVSNSLADVTTAEAVVAIAIALLIAAICNRTGHTRVAAYLVPSVMLLIMAANLLQGSLELIDLPIYDLFVIPIILIGFIGDRSAPWVFAAIAIAFVVGSYALETHVVLHLRQGVTFDGLTYEQHIFGAWGMVNRHVILLFFAALLGWLGARSVDKAIVRADRSDELAAFLEQTRRQEAQQAKQLQTFFADMLDAFTAQANGSPRLMDAQSYSAEPYRTYAHLMNERIRRFEQMRRGSQNGVQNQVEQALALVAERVELLRRQHLPISALTPQILYTGVPLVDKLTFLMLPQGAWSGRDTTRGHQPEPRSNSHF